MIEHKLRMIERAIERHHHIYPCRTAESLDECFTRSGGTLFFWYNTDDHNTHIMSEDISDWMIGAEYSYAKDEAVLEHA